jgi:protein involved in polysaccharide export with SLBB domain
MFMTKIKTLAIGLGTLTLVCGLGITAAHRLKAEDNPPRSAASPAADVKKSSDSVALKLQPPARMKPGNVLRIEALEALPDRPIMGLHVVRPDGTIKLNSYGDLAVAGLTRQEIKIKVVEHLRKYLDDDTLGLEEIDPVTGACVKLAPADSGRVFVDDSENYRRRPSAPISNLQGPLPVKPGDSLIVEVWEALPGRPITGWRLIRPDGTISLGFYGDLAVAGLTPREIKIKLIEHLREYLNDTALGLIKEDAKSHDLVAVAPADSDRVLVDERNSLWSARYKQLSGENPDLRAPSDRNSAPETAQRLADHDRRLGEIETKLDRLIRAIESLKDEGKP